MIITFGKFSGWSTEDLAKTTDGRNYLHWGMANLKSPKWQAEFKRVLSEVKSTELNINLEAELNYQSGDLDYEDALKLAQETKAQLEEEEEIYTSYEKARSNLIQNLKSIGVPDQHIKKLVGYITSGDNIDELISLKIIQFSSQESSVSGRIQNTCHSKDFFRINLCS